MRKKTAMIGRFTRYVSLISPLTCGCRGQTFRCHTYNSHWRALFESKAAINHQTLVKSVPTISCTVIYLEPGFHVSGILTRLFEGWGALSTEPQGALALEVEELVPSLGLNCTHSSKLIKLSFFYLRKKVYIRAKDIRS